MISLATSCELKSYCRKYTTSCRCSWWGNHYVIPSHSQDGYRSKPWLSQWDQAAVVPGCQGRKTAISNVQHWFKFTVQSETYWFCEEVERCSQRCYCFIQLHLTRLVALHIISYILENSNEVDFHTTWTMVGVMSRTKTRLYCWHM